METIHVLPGSSAKIRFWYYFDPVTGEMVKGLHWQDGAWYHFLPTTGAMQKGGVHVPEWNMRHRSDLVTERG